jgi:hypothetical protein
MAPQALPLLTDSQRKVVVAHVPELKNLVGAGVSVQEITKWKKKTVKSVLDALFESPPDRESQSAQVLIGKDGVRMTRAEVDEVSCHSDISEIMTLLTDYQVR